MKNTIEDLRNHLFETIESLKDTENPMDIDRAKAISETAQTMINLAKVEVDFIKTTGQTKDSGFLSNEKPQLPAARGAIE